MATVDGAWNCTVDSPMGAQEFVLHVKSDGNRFTGRAEGGMGAMELDGEVEGDTLRWSMRVSKPMPVTLDCQATVSGETIAGKLKAGIFGSFAVTGTRA